MEHARKALEVQKIPMQGNSFSRVLKGKSMDQFCACDFMRQRPGCQDAQEVLESGTGNEMQNPGHLTSRGLHPHCPFPKHSGRRVSSSSCQRTWPNWRMRIEEMAFLTMESCAPPASCPAPRSERARSARELPARSLNHGSRWGRLQRVSELRAEVLPGPAFPLAQDCFRFTLLKAKRACDDQVWGLSCAICAWSVA